MSEFSNQGPRKTRILSELERLIPEPTPEGVVASAVAEAIYEAIEQTLAKGEALLDGLKKYSTGAWIPVDSGPTIMAVQRFVGGDGRKIYYSDYTEVVDFWVKTAAEIAQRTLDVLETTNDFGLNKVNEAFKNANQDKDSLWNAVQAGIGLVILLLGAKVSNFFNMKNFGVLSGEESAAKTAFLADGLVGIAIYLLFSGEFNKLSDVKLHFPGIYDDELDQLKQKEGDIDGLITAAGFDPAEFKKSTRFADAKEIVRYCLEWIGKQQDNAERYTHWVIYTDAAQKQNQLVQCSKTKATYTTATTATESGFTMSMSPSVGSYFRYINESTDHYYNDIYSSLRTGLDSLTFNVEGKQVGLDMCCIISILRALGYDDNVTDMLKWLAKLCRAASTDPQNILAALVNDLLSKLDFAIDGLITQVVARLDKYIQDIERRLFSIFNSTAVQTIINCLAFNALLAALRSLIQKLRNALVDMLFMIADNTVPQVNYLRISTTKRVWLELANALEHLGDDIIYMSAQCDNQNSPMSEDAKWLSERVMQTARLPQLIIDSEIYSDILFGPSDILSDIEDSLFIYDPNAGSFVYKKRPDLPEGDEPGQQSVLRPRNAPRL